MELQDSSHSLSPSKMSITFTLGLHCIAIINLYLAGLLISVLSMGKSMFAFCVSNNYLSEIDAILGSGPKSELIPYVTTRTLLYCFTIVHLTKLYL